MNEAASITPAPSTSKAHFRKTILVLGGLLVCQIGLAGILRLGEREFKPVETSSAMLNCDTTKVNKIVIEDRKAEGEKTSTLVLEQSKAKGGWVIPSEHDFPADAAAIAKLLDMLRDLKKGIPVTTSTDAFERFKLSPDNFRRSITLTDQQGKSGKLFFGMAPSYKAVYVRPGDSNDIYNVELRNVIPVRSSDVFKKDFAQVYPRSISSLSIADFTINDNGKSWTVTSGGKDHALSGSNAIRMLGNALTFPINSVLGTSAKPEYNLDKPEIVCKFKQKYGNSTKDITYSFSRLKDKGSYVLKMSNNDYYLELATGVGESVKRLPETLLALTGKNDTESPKDSKENVTSQSK